MTKRRTKLSSESGCSVVVSLDRLWATRGSLAIVLGTEDINGLPWRYDPKHYGGKSV